MENGHQNHSKGRSAFNWDVYKNRKTALQYLKKNRTLVDTVLQTEDGSSSEFVHSQVISALSDKLTTFIDTHSAKCPSSKLKVVKLPRFDAQTLTIIVDCAYTGYLPTALEGVWKVLDVADHYEMTDVVKAVCIFLVKNLSRENCVHYYHIGLKHKHDLQARALHKIIVNFKHILNSNIQQVEGFFSSPTRRLNSDSIKSVINNLATIPIECYQQLLHHDKLNIDNEESVWHAIRLWCYFDFKERSRYVVRLMPCIRFPRIKSGPEFTIRTIWKDPLVLNNRQAQQLLALFDSNQRDCLVKLTAADQDGYGLPCSNTKLQLSPRVPYGIPLAIGGWQQGTPTTLIESFDVNCNMWFLSKHRIQFQLAYHGVEYINKLLYICGGTDGSEILGELFTFDPVSGESSQKPSMRESRCYVSTAHIDQALYAIGGHNGAQRMKSVEKFDIQSEFWTFVRDMNVARSDASACVHEGLIYIAGGLNDQVIESSVEFYNSSDDSWTSIASMITARTSFTLLLYHQKLLAIGGNNGSERLATVEEYSFATKAWSLHSQMKSRRSTFSAAILDDDRLIVAGGYNGQTPFNKVEMYDGQTRAWSNMRNIKFDRSGLKVVVINDIENSEDYTFIGHSNAPNQAVKQTSESNGR